MGTRSMGTMGRDLFGNRGRGVHAGSAAAPECLHKGNAGHAGSGRQLQKPDDSRGRTAASHKPSLQKTRMGAYGFSANNNVTRREATHVGDAAHGEGLMESGQGRGKVPSCARHPSSGTTPPHPTHLQFPNPHHTTHSLCCPAHVAPVYAALVHAPVPLEANGCS